MAVNQDGDRRKAPHRGGEREQSELVDKLVHIKSRRKVVEGRPAPSALPRSSSSATRRAASASATARRAGAGGDPQGHRRAKRNVTRVPLREAAHCITTCSAAMGRKVFLRAAPAGTGIIAGGPMRGRVRVAGHAGRVAKSIGFIEPLQHGARDLRCAEAPGFAAFVAARRSIKVSTLQGRRRAPTAESRLTERRHNMASAKTSRSKRSAAQCGASTPA